MYNQQETSWASGQLNENHERTDDLDGAAEGENDTSRVIPVSNSHQTAPSRPRSRRDSFSRGGDRDIRDDRDRDFYASSRNMSNRSHAGYERDRDGRDDSSRRRRTDSYMERDRDRDRGRGGEDYDYRDRDRRHNMSGSGGGGNTNSLPRNSQAGLYQDPYYHHMGAYNQNRGGYPMSMPSMHNMSTRDYLARLRLECPALYREWYAQFQSHKNNPHQVPFPPIPQIPMAGPMLGMTPGLGMTPYGPMTPNPYPITPGPNQSFGYADTSGYERHNIHSGRSSAELTRYQPPSIGGGAYYHQSSSVNTPSINQDPDSSIGFKPILDYGRPSETETPPPRRMTPLKYTIPHCIGSITPLGKLLRIKNGGTAIEIIDIKPLMKHLPEYKEVEIFPGPLVKGTTHKNNVIQFCQRKIKEAQQNEVQVDKENFILLWEYLILLLRQNGNVVGTDIAELLLKNTKSTDETTTTENINEEGQQTSENKFQNDEVENLNSTSEDEGSEETPNTKDKSNSNKSSTNKVLPVSEEKVTEKFCQLLLFGHKKDALEYAMSNALWGHAILLASKMDERTYGHVMARFANCTPYNHPLQTLYQIMSGKQPSSVTSCCDDSFGDWRPHLAMILSNAGARLDVESKAVITLGDTLASRNHVYAAQFCHLMGDVEFSIDSKLGPLLGLNHSAGNVTEATQMTEIFEFARSLSQSNSTLGPSFIKSKLNYARTILGLGFVTEAYAYCEEITKNVQNVKNTSRDEIDTIKWSVLQIAERLVRCENTTEDLTEEPKWIQGLRSLSINNSRSRDGKTESISDNASERRDSVPDTQSVPDYNRMNSVGENNEFGQEINNQYIPNVNDSNNLMNGTNSNINNSMPEYIHEQNSMQQMNSYLDQQNHISQQQQDGQIQSQSNPPYDYTSQHQQQQPSFYNVSNSQQQQQQPNILPNNNINNPPNPIHDLPPPQSQQQNYGSVPLDQTNTYGISQDPNQGQQQQQQHFQPQQQGPSDMYQPQQQQGPNDIYQPQQQQQQQGPTDMYQPNYSNNNYIPSGYSLPPLSDGPGGANKKKSVRFEEDEKNEQEDENSSFGNSHEDDEEEEEEDDDEDVEEVDDERVDHERQAILRQELGIMGNEDDEQDEFDFCHPLKSSIRKHYVGYKNNKPKVNKIDSFDYAVERPVNKGSMYNRRNVGGGARRVGGIEVPLNSDEIMEEIDRLASSSHSDHHSSSSSLNFPVTMGGTFPIDEPISAYPKTHGSSNSRSTNAHLGYNMKQKRTFPIDKHCCNENELCKDHDNFYNGISGDPITINNNSSSSSSLQNDCNSSGLSSGTNIENVTHQNSTSRSHGCEPNYYNDTAGTGAGPNSFAGKGFDNMQQPNYNPNQPLSYPNQQPPVVDNKNSSQKQQPKNEKASSKSKGDKGGGDGKQSKGLFGFFSKFRAPNQMILPDDKDPTIVWDEKTKRWVNTKDDDEDDSGPKGPPPTDTQLMGGPSMMGGPPMMMMAPPQQQQQQQQPFSQQAPMMQQIPSQPSSFQPNNNLQASVSSTSIPAQNVPFYAPQNPINPSENAYQPQNSQNFNDPYQNPQQQQQQQFNQPSLNNSTLDQTGPSLVNGPPVPTLSNKYKLPKNRTRYVDVLNPNSSNPNSAGSNSAPVSNNNNNNNNRLPNGGNMNGGPMVNMFIPQPSMGSGDSGPVNFLTPAPAIPPNLNQQSETTTN